MFERFALDTRAAVVLAQEEARESGGEIGAQHLLLGVLRAAGQDLAAVLGRHRLTADAVRARLVESSSAADATFDDDADALRAIGIDLRVVRDSVARTFGPDAFDSALRRSGRRGRRRGHVPLTRPAKKVVELALREALAHKDKEIRCEHIMLGILRGGDQTAVGLITEHVDTTQLRAAIVNLLAKAA
jgi:ATP-dependent Clp protease ATP-binding subunit ClpA